MEMRVETDVASLARNWWVFLLRGIVAIFFGVLTALMPGITLTLLVLLFGAYAIVEGGFNVVAGIRRRRGERLWWLLLLEGLVSIAAGVIAFILPGLTALMLVLVIGAWAIITGVLEIVAAILLRKQIRGEWWLALSGVLSLAFGVLVMLWPGPGALALVLWIAAYSIAFGVLTVALAFRLRGARERTAAAACRRRRAGGPDHAAHADTPALGRHRGGGVPDLRLRGGARPRLVAHQVALRARRRGRPRQLGAPPSGWTAVAKTAMPAVVNISSSKTVRGPGGSAPFFADPFFRFFPTPERAPRRERSLGSGVIVTADGYVLTNSHVVEGADQIQVTLDDRREFKAKLIGADPKSDLAVLKLPGSGFTLMTLGDSSKVEVAEVVLAIGNPFGLDRTVTMGIVSAVGRANRGDHRLRGLHPDRRRHQPRELGRRPGERQRRADRDQYRHLQRERWLSGHRLRRAGQHGPAGDGAADRAGAAVARLPGGDGPGADAGHGPRARALDPAGASSWPTLRPTGRRRERASSGAM